MTVVNPTHHSTARRPIEFKSLKRDDEFDALARFHALAATEHAAHVKNYARACVQRDAVISLAD